MDAETVESFTREAKLASHLHHSNIAQTYDLGRIDGMYFIAMELVGGPTLRQLVKQSEAAAGAIPIEHALCILGQVCEALDYAHNLADDKGAPLGIVHRDVSPANIIISGAGVVKLIDFGLAKVRAGPGTQAGILKGKLSYMAPEYTLGRLDARADLFAVGVIAHELLTGRRLFDSANDFDIIRMLREMPIQPPSRYEPRVSHVLDDIVMTALQRDPAQRWQSAHALHSALVNAARELGFALAPQALAKWVEWAFTQKPREEASALNRVIDMLGDPSEVSVERAPTSLLRDDTPSPVAPPPRATAETILAPVVPPPIPASGPRVPPPLAAMPPRPSQQIPTDKVDALAMTLPAPRSLAPGEQRMPSAPRKRWWPIVVVLLVLVVAGGGVAAWQLGYLDSVLLRFRN
jgi:serine/threonine protein kinase